MKDKKHPAIKKLLDDFNMSTYGRTRSGSLREEICSRCGKKVTMFNSPELFPEIEEGLVVPFNDDLSRKEYGITGWCQICQDDFFKNGEEG